MTSLTLLLAGWLGWCALHSLLIYPAVIERGQRLLGSAGFSYRLLYVLFSTATLIPLLAYQAGLPQRLLWSWQGPWRLAQAGLLLYAVFMAVAGARAHSVHELLGLEQIRRARRGLAPLPLRLNTGGILRHVRHPWYSGGIALLWGLGPVTDVSLAVDGLLTLYLLLGTALEERRLLAQFGETYRSYQRQTPALLPLPYRSRLVGKNGTVSRTP